MRLYWEEAKRQLVLFARDIDFAHLQDLFFLPYIEEQKNDDPEQYRIIGFWQGKLCSFIVEYRTDEQGEYIWVVTAWNSTKQEQQAYEQETRGY